MGCVTTFDSLAGSLGVVAAVAHRPVRTLLERAELVAPVDLVGRDARTVAFLRSLDLDPVEILGRDVVEAADAWVPSVYVPRRWARPMPSHSLLTVQ